jgi:hypothetical protein
MPLATIEHTYVVVAGAAADDAAERHHGVDVVAVGQHLCQQRHLDRARHAHDDDVVVIHAVLPQGAEGALEEAVDDQVVEAGRDQPDAESGAVGAAIDAFHGAMMP